MSILTELAHRRVDGCLEDLHLLIESADRGDLEILKGIVVDARSRLPHLIDQADRRLMRMNLPGFDQ